MKSRADTFAALTRKAAGNRHQARILAGASAHFISKRKAAFEAVPHPAELVRRATEARERTLGKLPELLLRLEERLGDAGVRVHWAADADEAVAVVSDIAREEGVSTVVKGKSMITEEIGLNAALESMGLDVLETDLGEYIVQLAGEGPSHIIAPAVHKSREEVARLFEEKLGQTAREAEELTMIARRVLRERFLTADMGITGVNMAVAETGTLVLLENEGNIRLSTTCPRVHVAVMSLEKVVEDFDDVAAVLAVLPRSATGQKLSSYVSFLTGSRRGDEHDGAEVTHLVILDNGRSRLHADPELRSMLRCVRCGACLAACPVYRAVGGHAYGWVYAGPIGALLTPGLLGLEHAADMPAACTTCGACAEVCPVSIRHHDILQTMRIRQAKSGQTSLALRAGAWLFAHLARRPAVFGIAGVLARLASPMGMPRGRKPFSRRWPALRNRLERASAKGHGGKD